MILVTGGAGFIGSVLIHKLNQMGREEIVLVDRLGKDEKWKNLNSLKFSEFIHADDLFHAENLSYLQKCTQIYHLGACSNTTEIDADYLMKNNWEFSKKLFQHATHNEVPILYASSAATYGLGESGYNDEEDQVENLRPLNIYGYSKQFFDKWVLAQKRKPNHWYGVKFFNVYGPNEYHKSKMVSVSFKCFHEIMLNGKARLFKSYHHDFKDGEQKRDFIYVIDAVNALVEMMEKKIESGIYNLGTGRAQSFNELIHGIYKTLGTSPDIEYIEMPEALKKQYQYFTQANMTKLTAQLPNLKFRNVEDGVEDYVSNYLNKDNRYL